MSLRTVLVSVEETVLEDLKAAGKVVESVFVSDSQAFVAKLKQMPIATAALNTIELLEDTSKSGEEKFAELVAKEGPALVSAVEELGGLQGLFSSSEALGKEFFNSLVNDFKSRAVTALGA